MRPLSDLLEAKLAGLRIIDAVMHGNEPDLVHGWTEVESTVEGYAAFTHLDPLARRNAMRAAENIEDPGVALPWKLITAPIDVLYVRKP